MSTQLEVHHIGSIGNESGRLSFSYIPDHNLISLHASVPADKRRSDILVQVTSTRALREIIEQLEYLEKTAKQHRAERDRPAVNQDGVTFNVMNTSLFVSNSILEEASRMIVNGDSQALPKEIQRSFPMLTPAAINELTHLIYINFRPRA